MNSKQALDKLVELIQVKIDDIQKVEDLFNIIGKDLEVLEILKNGYFSAIKEKNESLIRDWELVGHNDIVIKEWLDGEKIKEIQ